MQTPTLPKLEINYFDFWKSGFWEIEKSGPQNLKFGFDFEFLSQKFDFENPKSTSPIPFEFRFGTSKFEISDIENPESFIFTSKFLFSLQIFLRPKS